MVLQDDGFSGKSEMASVKYHGIFNYPLTKEEIKKWSVGKKGLIGIKKSRYITKTNTDFKERNFREKISEEKIKIAQKASGLLKKIPTIKGIFITGALAMKNADKNSDIDLMIITRKNLLWLTRPFVYLVLGIMNYGVRRPNDINQKDKFCLNIWLDELALSWGKCDRNIYSAHEIAQVIPIVNKENIHQRFLQKNRWILDYWPNSVRIEDTKDKIKGNVKINNLLERISFWIQYRYMKRKITREKIDLHKAIFHPKDWGKEINELLSA